MIFGVVGKDFGQTFIDRMNSEQFIGKRWRAFFHKKLIEKVGRVPTEYYALFRLEDEGADLPTIYLISNRDGRSVVSKHVVLPQTPRLKTSIEKTEFPPTLRTGFLPLPGTIAPRAVMHMPNVPKQLREIRNQVIGLLFDRYVFRTHQEIVRRNPRLQGRPRSLFSEWAQIAYAQAAAMGIRRLGSPDPSEDEVSLSGFLASLIRSPQGLWVSFKELFPDDADQARKIGSASEGAIQEDLACKRLIGEDRRKMISVADKAVRFASKRVAHRVLDAEVKTTFSDLDEAIDTLKALTEKYTRLVLEIKRRELEALHRAGHPTMYLHVLQKLKYFDLVEEMKRTKLQGGWDSVFLEAWATPETIALPLGDLTPPSTSE